MSEAATRKNHQRKMQSHIACLTRKLRRWQKYKEEGRDVRRVEKRVQRKVPVLDETGTDTGKVMTKDVLVTRIHRFSPVRVEKEISAVTQRLLGGV